MKDFFQTLLGIIIVGAVLMALILYFFPNPEALGLNGTKTEASVQEEEEQPTRQVAETGSFASELLPSPEEPPVYEPLADELLTGDLYNRPKHATPNMFDEAMQTVSASNGKSVAPSRIVVQKGDGEAYVWSEFEYDPDGNWMKQRIFPLTEGENAYEILYSRYGSIQKAGIARKQLITYDSTGFPSEGIGMDQAGRYRYFMREKTDIEYDTGYLYFLNHTDDPLYRIEVVQDLEKDEREEKYYEQRIQGGDFYITQHRVIDDKDRMRRIVDFSRHDNEEPLLKSVREYNEEARLTLFRTYDANRNITQEESFVYDPASGLLTTHTRLTNINNFQIAYTLSTASYGGAIRYADYFDRPDNNTVRRLSVNENDGYMEEATYHLTRNGDGNLVSVDSECGNATRKETWGYDGNGNWISYTVMNGEEPAYTVYVSYRETSYPYNKDLMQRRILSLEPLTFAAFFDEPVKDTFWWCAPECPVEERFVLSGLYY